ncbi:acyl-CoA dehydrogenase [Ferroacidibacillus organovorans]|uniref:Acyl-CoA dehydrogenase n=2 Tax=Ferroacidibacillus organovorans TaxID=1765683 RepID=A0A853K7X2_9BACL|nr:acyl-CoA dehydrogenase family protein [Ferroacidibacillus organovorans]KYP80398.1 acyl-CoA dehydrogenase [Ferroacidibacillus organovorans]OAG93160.1 acyl-CoA dehydrogenase [Ferroacidibacillus organovorans]
MNFSFHDDLLEMKKMVQSFIANEVEPYAMKIEEEDRVPDAILDASRRIGLFGLSIPERYGGLGLDMVGKSAIFEELGKTSNGYTTILGAHNGIGSVGIVELGNEEQKERYLPRMARGEWIGAFALTEPEAGSNAANLKTVAKRVGDRFVVNGQKIYCTNAPLATVFTVMAVTDPEAGSRGITSFLVERETPGFHVGAIEKKMGLHGSHTAQLYFEDMEVPIENVLGIEGMGYVNALKILANGRVGLAARCLGSSEYLLDRSLKHAAERSQFGKPLASQQIIQHYVAEMALEIETLRAFLYRVAWMIDQGEQAVKEAAMVKLYASEVYHRVADYAVQIHGGIGFIADYPIERFYRDARITRIYEGTSEIQKNIIADRLFRERGVTI